MDVFPAFFPLAGRTVVVVGEGPAADSKARLFDGSPARLVRLSESDARAPDVFSGASLVFIASQDADLIAEAAAAAHAAGAAVNVVDHPDDCDFYTPALVDRGEVVAAVSASGASPLLSALLRNDIETRLPDGVGRLAALLRATREAVREALPDMDRRRAFLRAAITGRAAQTAMAGDMALAHERLLAELDAFRAHAAVAGRVDVILGEGPAELLSLKAAQALSQADILIADAARAGEVVALARREADRRETIDEATLVDLVREGRRVVWAVADEPAADVVEAVRAAGGEVQMLHRAPV